MRSVKSVEFVAPATGRYAEILTPEAVAFVVGLQRTFNEQRKELLEARKARQKRLDAGERPDFLRETKHIRESEWTVAELPADLLDRRVEITGPVDRKMIINALNSGAKVFMADFEDSTTPTWDNVMDGQINLRDAVRRTITFEDEKTGKISREITEGVTAKLGQEISRTFEFRSEEQIIKGTWRAEVWNERRKIATKRFSIR